MEHDLVKDLRRRGYDCETATDAGMLRQPDERVVDYAIETNRIILTANQGDYMRISASLLRTDVSHPGMIIIPQQLEFGDKLRRLVVLLSSLNPETMHNRVEFLSNWPDE